MLSPTINEMNRPTDLTVHSTTCSKRDHETIGFLFCSRNDHRHSRLIARIGREPPVRSP